MSSLAFAAALLEYERALELWDGLEGATDIADFDRIELLRRAGRAAYMAAEDRRAVAHRREAVAASDPIADPARAGLLREELGRALWVFGDSPAALEMYRAAVATMPVEPPSAARARALGGLAQILMLIDRYHESIALSEEAIAMARAVGASAEEGHALNTRGRSRSLLGDCARGLADLREGLRIALDLRQADDIGRKFVNLTDELHDCGQIDDAVQEVALGIRIADEYGIGHMYGYYIRLNGVNAAYALGRWEEARRLLEEALARGPSWVGSRDLPTRQHASVPGWPGLVRDSGHRDRAGGGASRQQSGRPVHRAGACRGLRARSLAACTTGCHSVGRGRLGAPRRHRGPFASHSTVPIRRLGGRRPRRHGTRHPGRVTRRRGARPDRRIRRVAGPRASSCADPDWDRELEATQATLDGEAKRVSGDVDPAVWGEDCRSVDRVSRPYVHGLLALARGRDSAVSRRSSEGDEIAAGGAGDRGRIGRAPLLEAVEAL